MQRVEVKNRMNSTSFVIIIIIVMIIRLLTHVE